MRVIIALAWIWALLGSLAGCAVLVGGVATASGSPQEAAIAGIALCLAALPYCFARGLSALRSGSDAMREEERAKKRASVERISSED